MVLTVTKTQKYSFQTDLNTFKRIQNFEEYWWCIPDSIRNTPIVRKPGYRWVVHQARTHAQGGVVQQQLANTLSLVIVAITLLVTLAEESYNAQLNMFRVDARLTILSQSSPRGFQRLYNSHGFIYCTELVTEKRSDFEQFRLYFGDSARVSANLLNPT